MAGAETNNASGAEDDFCDPDEPEDEHFHQRFITEMRQKEQLEKIKEARGVNFEEDDDEFIIDLNS